MRGEAKREEQFEETEKESSRDQRK